MKIVIPGGSGLLGRSLGKALVRDGHEVVVLTRSLQPGVVVHESNVDLPGLTNAGWQPDGTNGVGSWARLVDGATAVVNLTGEPIAAKRWSVAQKACIRDSRVLGTRSVVGAIQAASDPPATLVNASAIGYYSNRGDEELSEDSAAGNDFMAKCCIDWEDEARKAEGIIERLVILRTGIALDRTGGALQKMLPPFKMFVGGPLGSGRQYMSWIHYADWVDLVRWALVTEEVTGVFNATAPAPVTNSEFSKALGRALHRPSLMPAPAFALRLALGEMADALLLGGQRVQPSRALKLGFRFNFSTISQALTAVLQ